MVVSLMLVCFPIELRAMLSRPSRWPYGHANFDDPLANAGFSSMWRALPEAVYDDRSKTLHVATGYAPLADCDTIYVRDCHTQLTNMALGMTPFYPVPGTM